MRLLPLDAPRGPGSFQIVATLGPASLAQARELAEAGATAFRLNASHLAPAEVAAAVARARAAVPGVPLVVDLQGAKLRLGVFAERSIEAGDVVRFALAPAADEIPLPHPEVFAAAHPGDTLSLDDDRLRFHVRDAGLSSLEAVALTPGTLRPRKGVNVVEHPVLLRALPDHDRAVLAALPDPAAVAWAFSFMKDGAEAAWLRAAAPGAKVVGKVEHPDAVKNLSAIDAAVDAVWICRGDLGAQLGMARLGRFVAGVAPPLHRRPFLMAGQVLEHLTAHAEPTRSEVCHLHDLAARGFAGIVLSDETAIGRHPAHAVAQAASLLAAMAEG
jgi:pyruvate kinase